MEPSRIPPSPHLWRQAETLQAKLQAYPFWQAAVERRRLLLRRLVRRLVRLAQRGLEPLPARLPAAYSVDIQRLAFCLRRRLFLKLYAEPAVQGPNSTPAIGGTTWATRDTAPELPSDRDSSAWRAGGDQSGNGISSSSHPKSICRHGHERIIGRSARPGSGATARSGASKQYGDAIAEQRHPIHANVRSALPGYHESKHAAGSGFVIGHRKFCIHGRRRDWLNRREECRQRQPLAFLKAQ